MSRRILLANVTLGGHTGTEVVTRDLALGFAQRGHRVSVFTRTLGPIADELIAAGVPVAARLDDLPAPDLVHGHHYLETVEALMRFPRARGVFVCHDRTAPHSIPPRLDRIRRYVAVDEPCLERLREDWGIPASRTCVINNAVDTVRFRPRGRLPPVPARALVFSHYASPSTHLDIVRKACARIGLAVDVLGGGVGAVSTAPEAVLGQYDLVFAKARCALEAMAVGAAVVLCDAGGVGPMVTLAELPGLRPWNFGARLLRDTLDPDTLLREIRRYDPADAVAVSRAIRAEASLTSALDRYESLYDEVLSDPAPAADAGTQELVAPLIQRVSRLEAELAAYRRPERMLALSDAALSALRISLEQAPATVPAGAAVFVRVRLHNDLPDDPLGSWPPFPLQWVYRWRREDAPGFLDREPVRTKLHWAVPPRGSDGFGVAVVAPVEPGVYVLRITLVQEGVRWLDRTAAPVLVEAPILVSEI